MEPGATFDGEAAPDHRTEARGGPDPSIASKDTLPPARLVCPMSAGAGLQQAPCCLSSTSAVSGRRCLARGCSWSCACPGASKTTSLVRCTDANRHTRAEPTSPGSIHTISAWSGNCRFAGLRHICWTDLASSASCYIAVSATPTALLGVSTASATLHGVSAVSDGIPYAWCSIRTPGDAFDVDSSAAPATGQSFSVRATHQDAQET